EGRAVPQRAAELAVARQSTAEQFGLEVVGPASLARPLELVIGVEARRQPHVAAPPQQGVADPGTVDVDLGKRTAPVAQLGLTTDPQLVVEAVAVVVVVAAYASAPVDRRRA